MKLSKEGQTLFDALCALFTNKVGAHINKRSFGDYATLIASRNDEGQIERLNLVFRKTNVMTITPNNSVFPDATAWLTKATMNKFNKILSVVGLTIYQKNGAWQIKDAAGTATAFQNAKELDLTRPHGAAIYPQE